MPPVYYRIAASVRDNNWSTLSVSAMLVVSSTLDVDRDGGGGGEEGPRRKQAGAGRLHAGVATGTGFVSCEEQREIHVMFHLNFKIQRSANLPFNFSYLEIGSS